MAKYHLENIRELTLAYITERLQLVEQKIKDEMTFKEDTANKASSKGKSRPLCFYCEKSGYFMVKCFK